MSTDPPRGISVGGKNLKDKKPKTGDYIAVSWKKKDGSLWGGTEGYVLGTINDSDGRPYLLLDRSTYKNSLKAALFSLSLLDLWMTPLSEVESILEIDQRDRPPGIKENMHFKVEIDYKSNIDYEETRLKINRKGNCTVEVNQPVQTEGLCSYTVRNIENLEEATIVFSPSNNIQIHCLPKQLPTCLKWLERSIEILPSHSRLILIPTNFMFNIHNNFQETAYPTEELIDRIGLTTGNSPVIFPLGWAHYFFVDLENNPLKEVFSNSKEIADIALTSPKKKRNKVVLSIDTDEKRQPRCAQTVNLSFLKDQKVIDRYLSSEAPIMQIRGLILKPEDRNGLKNMWFASRPYSWQWLDSRSLGGFRGKINIRSVMIGNKTYTTDFYKYYGTDF